MDRWSNLFQKSMWSNWPLKWSYFQQLQIEAICDQKKESAFLLLYLNEIKKTNMKFRKEMEIVCNWKLSVFFSWRYTFSSRLIDNESNSFSEYCVYVCWLWFNHFLFLSGQAITWVFFFADVINLNNIKNKSSR